MASIREMSLGTQKVGRGGGIPGEKNRFAVTLKVGRLMESLESLFERVTTPFGCIVSIYCASECRSSIVVVVVAAKRTKLRSADIFLPVDLKI